MKFALLYLLPVLVCLPASGQQRQQHINRLDVFTGYSYINTPVVNLPQHGFEGTVGIHVRRWVALGADFSVYNGNTPLTVNQTKLASTLSPLLPSALMSYGLPTSASTWTFAAGPQFNIRKWEKLTVFIRPGLGVMTEKIKLKYAGTPFEALLPSLGKVAPGLSANQSDRVPFYGVGGGIEISSPSRNLGLRISLDYIHSKMFSSLLPAQNTIRIGIGPQWKFGELKQGRK